MFHDLYMACPSWYSFFFTMTGYSGSLVNIDNSMKSPFLASYIHRHHQGQKHAIRKVMQKMLVRDLFFLAILSFFISVTFMLTFTIAQQSETMWVRLLTVAALPAPSLALFIGTVALIVTNSRQWGIAVAILGYILAMLVALPTQKIILSLWRRIRK
jgi:hypothetical protein